MCLIAKTCRIKANTDLVVRKQLERFSYLDPTRCYRTPYMGYTVCFINNTKEMNSKLEAPNKYGSIYFGIHSYIGLTRDYYTQRPYWPFESPNSRFFYAVIPKGSELYFGWHGDVVSDKLIIFESKKGYLEYKKTHKVVSAVSISSNFSKELFDKRNIMPSISL